MRGMIGPPGKPVSLDSQTLATVSRFYEAFAPAGQAPARFDRTFRNIANALCSTFDTSHVILWVPDPEAEGDEAVGAGDRGRLNPAFTTFPAEMFEAIPDSVPMTLSRVGRAFAEGRARFYPELDAWASATEYDLLREHGLAGMWAIPLRPMVQRITTRELDPHNVLAVALAGFPAKSWVAELAPEALGFFGSICGRAIERALWAEQDLVSQKAYEALDAVETDRFKAMATVAAVIKDCMQFEACTILQADGPQHVLRVLGTTGLDSRIPLRKMYYNYGEGCTGWVAENRKTLATEDLRSCPLHTRQKYPDVVVSAEHQQYLGTPMLSNAGELLGVIRLRNKLPPDGQAWPRCLNHLDRIRVERVAKLIAPLMSLLIKERQVSGVMERIQHDLTMPAMAIRDGAGMLLRESDATICGDLDRVRQKLEDIESFGEILLLNSEIMGLTPEVELTLRPENVLPLGGFIVKLCKMLGPAARRRGLNGILYNQGSFMSIPALWIDPRLFQVAMYNLLQNALKYSARDSLITIEGETTRTEGEVWHLIHVKNTGIGITDEEAPHIFERHWRSPRARRRSNTGLGIGLATASEIIRRHGGRLVLTHAHDPTVFTIELPAQLATCKPA